MSRDGWAALPRGAIWLSAVCDCGISWLYSLTIFVLGFDRWRCRNVLIWTWCLVGSIFWHWASYPNHRLKSVSYWGLVGGFDDLGGSWLACRARSRLRKVWSVRWHVQEDHWCGKGREVVQELCLVALLIQRGQSVTSPLLRRRSSSTGWGNWQPMCVAVPWNHMHPTCVVVSCGVRYQRPYWSRGLQRQLVCFCQRSLVGHGLWWPVEFHMNTQSENHGWVTLLKKSSCIL